MNHSAGQQSARPRDGAELGCTFPFVAAQINKGLDQLLSLTLIDFRISKDVNFKMATFGDISLSAVRTWRAPSILIWGTELFRVWH